MEGRSDCNLSGILSLSYANGGLRGGCDMDATWTSGFEDLAYCPEFAKQQRKCNYEEAINLKIFGTTSHYLSNQKLVESLVELARTAAGHF